MAIVQVLPIDRTSFGTYKTVRYGTDGVLRGGAVPWAELSNLPSTLAGYGITDAQPAWGNQNANLVVAGPASGPAGPVTMRPLVAADIPATLNKTSIVGDASVANPILLVQDTEAGYPATVGFHTSQDIIEVHLQYAGGLSMYGHSDTSFRAPTVNFYRSGGSIAGPTAVQNGFQLLNLNLQAHDGTGYAAGVQITANAGQTWTGTAHGALFSIATAANGATDRFNRILIDAAGNTNIQNGNLIAGAVISASHSATISDVATNAIANALTVGHNSSNTPLANFGTGILFTGKDSTSPDQTMAQDAAIWTTATHSAPVSARTWSLVNGTAGTLAEFMRLTPTGLGIKCVPAATADLHINSSNTRGILLNAGGAVTTGMYLYRGGNIDAQDTQLNLISETSYVSLYTSAEVCRADQKHNFAIGTTAATSLFQVNQATTGPGTVTTTAGGTTVVGVGTQFLNTFKVGDTLTVSGETRTISAIASDTSMTTDAWTGAFAGLAYTLVGGTRFSVLGNGNVGFGTATPAAKLNISQVVNNATITDAIRLTETSNAGTGRNAISWYVGTVPIARLSAQPGGGLTNSTFYVETADSSDVFQQRLTIDVSGVVTIPGYSGSNPLAFVTGNGLTYLSHVNAGVSDYFSIGGNFKRTSGSGGTLPSAYGTTEILSVIPYDSDTAYLSFSTGFRNVAPSERMRITAAGLVGIGTTPATQLHAVTTDAIIGAVTNVLTVGHNTTTVGATGLGTGILLQGHDTTSPNQDMGQIAAVWSDATHATATSYLGLSAVRNGALAEYASVRPGQFRVQSVPSIGTISLAFYDGASFKYEFLLDASNLFNLRYNSVVLWRTNQIGQISVGGSSAIAASALVEMNSTTLGFLPPRMTNTQMNAISTPAEGLIVYDLTNHVLNYYNGTAWTPV